MSKWETRKLGDISEMCLGKMLDKHKNKGELEPYLANINVRWGGFYLGNLSKMRFEKGESERYGLRFGDLIVCEGGEPGRCAIWKDAVPSMKIQKALHRVRIHQNYSSEFVYYRFLLAGRDGELYKYFIGSTIKHLTGIGLKQVEFTYPSLKEQQKIASVLSALDAKIDLNNRINAELDAMAKTLYDYWFVQFDFPFDFTSTPFDSLRLPSTSLRAGRSGHAAQGTPLSTGAQGKPDKNGKPYKSSGGKLGWNKELKREIPDGWKVVELRDCLNCNLRTLTNTKDQQSISYLDTSNLTGNRIDVMQEIDCTCEEVPVRAKRIISKNDILISTVRPNQNHFGIIKEPVDNMIASTGFAVLSSNINAISNDFFYMFITNDSNLSKLQRIAESATSSYPSISPEDILNLKIALPENKELLKIANDMFDSILTKVTKTHKENQHLSSLRDWLLPMLMNGQVKVS